MVEGNLVSIEIELINQAVKGDKNAFCKLISMHRAKLRSFAVNITGGDQATADDILQESLIKAYRALPRYDNKGSFTTWLWRIIKNEFINHLRTPAYKVEAASVDTSERENLFRSEEDCESFLLENEVKNSVRELISHLPEKLKAAVILVDLEEMCYEDAADILEISLTALKSRVFKGRKKLIEIVEEKMGGETTLDEEKPL
jgi:RNA polymerase sigma-70 factor, ECF subfamily